jgi:hypothetical protein
MRDGARWSVSILSKSRRRPCRPSLGVPWGSRATATAGPCPAKLRPQAGTVLGGANLIQTAGVTSLLRVGAIGRNRPFRFNVTA